MECSRLLDCCCPPKILSCTCPCLKKKKRYSHIEYYQPSRAIGVSEDAGIKKIFDFPQEKKNLFQHFHSDNKTTPSAMATGGTMPVIQQPAFRETGCEPMYISDKGRTIGTISELPLDLHTKTPPFTPPPEHQVLYSSSLEIQAEPAIEFSLYYDIQKRLLSVHLVCAHNMRNEREPQGIADSFMSVFLLPGRDKIYHTNILLKDPSTIVINEVYEFPSLTSEELHEQVLVFQLFSQDKFNRDHLMGSVIVPFSEADLFGIRMVRKIGEGRELLQQFATGDIFLSLCYNPLSQVINGVILKASNLPRPHKWGLADPYVKVYLLYKQKRMNKWKSTTKKSTVAPVFNDAFEFKIFGMDLKDICIEVFVMDHDMLRRNDVIGMVYIGPAVHTNMGVTHFEEMLASPHHPISHWHKLIPHPHRVKTRKRHKSNTM